MWRSILYTGFSFCCIILHAQPYTQLPAPKISGSENPAELVRKNIFVKVGVSKNEVYVGEPVLVTYYLWSAFSIEPRVSRQPVFEGCSINELTIDNGPFEEILDGKKFRVFTMRRVLLTPLQEGDITPGAAAVENILQIEHTDGSGFENYAATVVSDAYVIHVKPLPPENKPENFSNAVGNFSISAAADKAMAHAGEIVTLKIKVEGNGNFNGISLPSVQWPHGVEHFESSDSQYISQLNYPGMGTKIFQYSFMAEKECSINLPPVSFSFFNPETKNYTTIFTNPVAITFTKPVAKKDWWKNVISEDISNRKYLWIVPAIALAVITVVSLTRRLSKKKSVRDAAEKERRLKESAEARASVIKKNEIREVFISLNELCSIAGIKKFSEQCRNILIKTLQLKLNSGIHSEYELLNMLSRSDADIAQECGKLFKTCDAILYTPDGEEPEREEMYFRLTSAVKKLLEVS